MPMSIQAAEENLGVPAAGIALVLGADRILDMSRTAIDVAGDLVACLLMEGWQQSQRESGAIIGTPANVHKEDMP